MISIKAVSVPRQSTEDAHFTVNAALSPEDARNPNLGEKRLGKRDLFMPKGSNLTLDAAVLHYNRE
jgi:hypothetical protein